MPPCLHTAGEARGFPQNTKCRGTVADVAGFRKETAYWLRSWWLSNISATDAGRPPLGFDPSPVDITVFIVDSWQPRPGVYHNANRTITVYSNAPLVALELNGARVTQPQAISFFGQATFTLPFTPGNLTAVGLDHMGARLAQHSVLSPQGPTASLVLSLDAPSPETGTGTTLVADGEDVAMVRATLLDTGGHFAYNAADNVSFRVVSGPGRIWATHNGDPASDTPRDVPWHPAYKGLARAFVRTTTDAATPLAHRARVREIDVESGLGESVKIDLREAPETNDIVLEASLPNNPSIASVQITIPVSADVRHLPRAVAAQYL